MGESIREAGQPSQLMGMERRWFGDGSEMVRRWVARGGLPVLEAGDVRSRQWDDSVIGRGGGGGGSAVCGGMSGPRIRAIGRRGARNRAEVLERTMPQSARESERSTI